MCSLRDLSMSAERSMLLTRRQTLLQRRFRQVNNQPWGIRSRSFCFDWSRKFIHRCFACQNLVLSHELVRRIRPGRLYHADCFACSKCKKVLQDDDISALFKSDGSSFNDMECACQTCLNPNSTAVKSSEEKPPISDAVRGLFLHLIASFPHVSLFLCQINPRRTTTRLRPMASIRQKVVIHKNHRRSQWSPRARNLLR